MTFELAALMILAGAAALLVLLWLIGQRQDRDFDQPLILPPAPERYRSRHSTDGETTRLIPPSMRPED